jgi:hypothetical protein
MPALAMRYDTNLELVLGRSRIVLDEQLGGLAGIRRW